MKLTIFLNEDEKIISYKKEIFYSNNTENLADITNCNNLEILKLIKSHKYLTKNEFLTLYPIKDKKISNKMFKSYNMELKFVEVIETNGFKSTCYIV